MEPYSEEPPPEGGSRSRLWLLGGAGVAAAVVAGVALSSGNDVVWSDAGNEARPVVATATAQPKAAPRTDDPANLIRGVIKAKSEATIASRLTARITSMPYKVGDSFGAGAPLVRFDCSTIHARLNAARAATAAYQKTYETNVELDQYQAVGKNDVAVSKANLGKASAEANAIGAELRDCGIYAPFSGRVVEKIGNVQEVAASGQPLMKIQSGGALEVDLIVPSNWLTWLRRGADFAFRIDETGESVQGKVTRLGAAVDPVSKTIRITGDIAGATGPVLPGMSGSATFPQPTATKPVDGKQG
jgi:membrane fusion protein, multidrug efflux system